MPETDAHRLPRSVLPRRYDLTLAPDLGSATFTGEVVIGAEVVDETDTITLNAIELAITEAWVMVGDTRSPAAVALDEETERATLTLDRTLPRGPVEVGLRFDGILNDKLRGFYLSTFTGADGAEQRIATTQFEATDARRAFPCWDEPDLKATFAITLDVPDDLFAVSNAAELSSTPLEGGRRRVRFADTMTMSTYLVAFVVGPLEATAPVDVDGVPLRVIHRAGQGHLTAFALESGAFALRHFSEYFGRPYPADKLDLVAVPDFAFGAMENLGCVTFRDALLLVDPEASTQPELQRVADVIHHEIAHMWFGDLVTMGWWNGIWLNEAFATFMEMRCTDAFRPEWDRWTDFGIARTAAYDTDALSSTRPIEFEVVSPADAEGMFDVLTYEKGAAVVRMLEQYLGEERFRDGIRLYMRRHAFGNTETTDLWDAIEEASGEPVRAIMDSWIFQGGHPEVAVSVSPEEGGGARVALAQRRFRYRMADEVADTEAPDARWIVPVLVRWAAAGAPDGDGEARADISAQGLERVLLDGETTAVEIAAHPAWVLANSGGSGFFRVRYDGPARAALADHAAALTPLERYGLVDDTWASLLADTVTVAEVLALVETLATTETDLSVWQRMIGVLGSLDRLVPDDSRADLRRWALEVLAPASERLGDHPRPDESARDRSLRAALLAARGLTGDEPAALARARDLMTRPEADADQRDAAVRIVAAHADATTFADLRARAESAATPQDRLRHQGALADVPGDVEMDTFLALTLTDEIRTQDAPFLLGRALGNRPQTERVWAFVAERWEEIGTRFPSNSISRMLAGVRLVSRADLAAEIDAFLDAHPVPQGAKPIAQHRERMAANVALAARLREALPASLGARA